MADTSNALFYNSENGDRVYDADSFEHLLKKFFTSGVFAGSCRVTADGEGMTCSMSDGYSNCDGKVRFFGSATPLALQNAHATYDRIDTVVIERNDSNREITAKVITGGYSANPIPTAPVRSGGVFQLVVAQIYVAAGVVRITQANITDKRPDTSVCGYVMCAVQTPDFSELYRQFTAQANEVVENTEADLDNWKTGFESGFESWRDDFQDDAEDFESTFESTAQQWYTVQTADFAAWFAGIRDQLDTDQAGHLQNEITQLKENYDDALASIGLYVEDGAFYILNS